MQTKQEIKKMTKKTKHTIFMSIKKFLKIDELINTIADKSAVKHGWVYADTLEEKLNRPIVFLYKILVK